MSKATERAVEPHRTMTPHQMALRIVELEQQRDELMEALQGMIDIANDSQGVAGYHLNGEVADWGEFVEWQAACDAIARAKGGAANHSPDAGKMVPDDYFASLVATARVSANKAMKKFPQPNYVLLKVAEESGEVVQVGVHYAEGRMGWDKVEGEIVQLLAMLIRLVTEGDMVNGVIPPDSVLAAAPKPEGVANTSCHEGGPNERGL